MKPQSELSALVRRLGPNATGEQLREAVRNNPQAFHELMTIRIESEVEAANTVLRQRLDDDPLLALTIIRTIGWL
jgi:hypothetical protein